MVTMVLMRLREKFYQRLQTPFGQTIEFKGELYRADAKAQGDLIVIGAGSLRDLTQLLDADGSLYVWEKLTSRGLMPEETHLRQLLF